MTQTTMATRTNFRSLLIAFLIGSLALFLLSLMGTAGATGLDASLNPAATQICKNLDAIANSAFVSVIALAMFVGGGAMVWLKIRGGMGLAAFGLVGFFVVKKLVPIAKSFGILPAGITC